VRGAQRPQREAPAAELEIAGLREGEAGYRELDVVPRVGCGESEVAAPPGLELRRLELAQVRLEPGVCEHEHAVVAREQSREPEGVVVVRVREHDGDEGERGEGRELGAQGGAAPGIGEGVDDDGALGAEDHRDGNVEPTVPAGADPRPDLGPARHGARRYQRWTG